MENFPPTKNRSLWVLLFCLLALLTPAACRSTSGGGTRPAGAGDRPEIQKENPSAPAAAANNEPAITKNDRPAAAPAAPGGERPQRPEAGGAGQAATQVAAGGPNESNPLRLVVTEAQLNLALDAVEGNSSAEATLTINSATVDFTNGAILFSASVTSAQFSGDLTATLQPYVTADGKLQFTLTNLSLNNQPIPPALLEPIQASMQEAIYAALEQTPDQLQIKSVQVTDTELIIEAFPKS